MTPEEKVSCIDCVANLKIKKRKIQLDFLWRKFFSYTGEYDKISQDFRLIPFIRQVNYYAMSIYYVISSTKHL